MLTKRRFNFFTPAVLAPGSNLLLGTTVKFNLDRTWPCEGMVVVLSLTMGSTAPTLTAVDGLINVLKRVNITVNDGNQPRTLVDFQGAGLIEYCRNIGVGLDRSTVEALRLGKLAAGTGQLLANQNIRIAYIIPFVHPGIAEPLKTRCLVPMHLYPQDPIVTIDFETSGNMYSAGSISGVSAEYLLIRREMPTALDATIQSNGGYIPMDLIETPFSIGTGISGEQRFPVPIPGSYLNLNFRQYLGGSTITRQVLDQTTTFGSEQRWRIETGGLVIKEWRWKYIQILNDIWRGYDSMSNAAFASGAQGSYTSAVSFDASPDFGVITSGTSQQAATSTLLDFLIAGTADTSDELGSLLDCNLAANSGLKMEVIGSVASVATNASTLWIGGQRFYGDLSKWQSLAA